MKKKLFMLLTTVFFLFIQVSISQSQIEPKEKFDFVFSSFKDVHNAYVIDVMKTIALLVICLGWLITSDKCRDFIRKTKTARVSSIIILVLLCIINISTSIRAYRFSQDKITELSILKYIEPIYYKNYEISVGFLAANLIVHTALFALLIVILFSLKEKTPQK